LRIKEQEKRLTLNKDILRERDYLEDPDVGVRLILRWIFRKGDWWGMDWIYLVQVRDRRRALINVVRKVRFP
jgi:hypothetical protein